LQLLTGPERLEVCGRDDPPALLVSQTRRDVAAFQGHQRIVRAEESDYRDWPRRVTPLLLVGGRRADDETNRGDAVRGLASKVVRHDRAVRDPGRVYARGVNRDYGCDVVEHREMKATSSISSFAAALIASLRPSFQFFS
jgi:hypothetical protein